MVTVADKLSMQYKKVLKESYKQRAEVEDAIKGDMFSTIEEGIRYKPDKHRTPRTTRKIKKFRGTIKQLKKMRF